MALERYAEVAFPRGVTDAEARARIKLAFGNVQGAHVYGRSERAYSIFGKPGQLAAAQRAAKELGEGVSVACAGPLARTPEPGTRGEYSGRLRAPEAEGAELFFITGYPGEVPFPEGRFPRPGVGALIAYPDGREEYVPPEFPRTKLEVREVEDDEDELEPGQKRRRRRKEKHIIEELSDLVSTARLGLGYASDNGVKTETERPYGYKDIASLLERVGVDASELARAVKNEHTYLSLALSIVFLAQQGDLGPKLLQKVVDEALVRKDQAEFKLNDTMEWLVSEGFMVVGEYPAKQRERLGKERCAFAKDGSWRVRYALAEQSERREDQGLQRTKRSLRGRILLRALTAPVDLGERPWQARAEAAEEARRVAREQCREEVRSTVTARAKEPRAAPTLSLDEDAEQDGKATPVRDATAGPKPALVAAPVLAEPRAAIENHATGRLLRDPESEARESPKEEGAPTLQEQHWALRAQGEERGVPGYVYVAAGLPMDGKQVAPESIAARYAVLTALGREGRTKEEVDSLATSALCGIGVSADAAPMRIDLALEQLVERGMVAKEGARYRAAFAGAEPAPAVSEALPVPRSDGSEHARREARAEVTEAPAPLPVAEEAPRSLNGYAAARARLVAQCREQRLPLALYQQEPGVSESPEWELGRLAVAASLRAGVMERVDIVRAARARLVEAGVPPGEMESAIVYGQFAGRKAGALVKQGTLRYRVQLEAELAEAGA